MSAHHCHALLCRAPCPPRHLMCAAHWRQVPAPLQAEVYATVKERGPRIDATWAPWWRAQTEAIYVVAQRGEVNGAWLEKWHAKELAFADQLDGRGHAPAGTRSASSPARDRDGKEGE